MTKLQKAFTLNQLMIVVAIIGILAAIAIPAYQDYTIRAQVSEGLTLASDVKAGIAEYAAQVGDWPVDLREAGLGSAVLTDKQGRYVESLDVDSAGGTMIITYGRDANDKIQQEVLAIQPFANVNGDVIWRCGMSNAPVAPATAVMGSTTSVGSDTLTTLSDKHMPASCRTGFGGS